MNETNVKIVRDFLDHWESRNVEGILDRLTDDAVIRIDHDAPACGKAVIRPVLEAFMSLMSSVRFEVLHVATEGNLVMTERIDHFEVSGRGFAVPFMGVFEVRDGKVAGFRDYFDQRTFEIGAGFAVENANAEALAS